MALTLWRRVRIWWIACSIGELRWTDRGRQPSRERLRLLLLRRTLRLLASPGCCRRAICSSTPPSAVRKAARSSASRRRAPETTSSSSSSRQLPRRRHSVAMSCSAKRVSRRTASTTACAAAATSTGRQPCSIGRPANSVESTETTSSASCAEAASRHPSPSLHGVVVHSTLVASGQAKRRTDAQLASRLSTRLGAQSKRPCRHSAGVANTAASPSAASGMMAANVWPDPKAASTKLA
mmetsp:Transcript_9331/g.22186  ORF Transcript_9331/g.22186 Transcript_9331/m.22186 type:complete len:238 (-) Transcript_9331:289-1002(-)